MAQGVDSEYIAVGEPHVLTLAKNAAADQGGHVLLVMSLTTGDAFTTEVHGKIDACPPTR